jgi:hypothetical protein
VTSAPAQFVVPVRSTCRILRQPVTNEIRREKRLLLEQLRLNEEIERMVAADRARRERRRRRAWIERYGPF